MASPLIVPVFHWSNVNLASSAGYQLFSYFAGTLNLQATWTDASLSVVNANPVILDANGDANVWIGAGLFKFILKDNLGNTIWTVDNVSQSNLSNSFGSEYAVVASSGALFISTTSFSVTGDQTGIFLPRMMVRFNGSNVNTIVSASFGAGITTVTMGALSGPYFAVPNPITLLELSVFGQGAGGSQGGLFSEAKRSVLQFGNTGTSSNLATATLYALGAAAPWVQGFVNGDDFSEVSLGSFTPKTLGRFLITAHCSYNVAGATITAPGQMTLYLNGVAQTPSRVPFCIGTGGTQLVAHLSTILQYGAGAGAIQVKLDNGPTISAGTPTSANWEVNVVQVW